MHVVYHLLLPWLGYLALLWATPHHAGPAILCGWILLLVWYLIAPQPAPLRWRGLAGLRSLLWLAVPALVLLAQPGRLGGTLATALIELAICEFAAFTLALAAVMVGWKAPDKGMAWPGILLMLGFSGALLYSLVQGWMALHPLPAWWQLTALLLALGLALTRHARFALGVAAGRLAPGGEHHAGSGLHVSTLADSPLMIVGLIVLWFLLPLVLKGVRWLWA